MPILYSCIAMSASFSLLSNPQAENLADFYDFCKDLELARRFQFPTLRQVGSSIACCTSCHLYLAAMTGMND